MTVRLPKLLVVALAGALVLVGAGVGIYAAFAKSSGPDCVSSASGKPLDCGRGGSVSPEAYKRARHLQAECHQKLGPFLTALQGLDSRLDVGLTFAEYGSKVGDIQVVYDRIPFKALGVRCTSDVGVPAEDALNDYARADNVWNDCIGRFSCDTDSIDPQLQDKWSSASSEINQARSGLRSLGQPTS